MFLNLEFFKADIMKGLKRDASSETALGKEQFKTDLKKILTSSH
jgi:hypothetical protein